MLEINEQNYPLETIWEGALESKETIRGQNLPVISLSKPLWWDDPQILGKAWVRPAGGKQYGMVRFNFSLRPEKQQEIRQVEFTVYLVQRAQCNTTFYDLFPKQINDDLSGEISASIGPELNFAGNEVKVGGVGVKVHTKQSFPVVVASGVGEQVAQWRFVSRPSHPLTGSQSVFAIIEYKDESLPIHASLHLDVTVASFFGPVHGILPQTETQRLHWISG